MDRSEPEIREPLIDLGAAVVETRGGPATMPELSQEQVVGGLSDD
jgi:hypothetical protein